MQTWRPWLFLPLSTASHETFLTFSPLNFIWTWKEDLWIVEEKKKEKKGGGWGGRRSDYMLP